MSQSIPQRRRCCGVMPIVSSPGRTPAPTATPIATPLAPAPPEVRFRYVGATALTVRGPATGRRYHFATSDAELVVDGHDAPAITAVPQLRRVRA